MSLARRIPFINTLTSCRCAMKVIEEARKRTKSKAMGMGDGSRKGISNVVHLCVDPSPEGGNFPRRAYNYMKTISRVMVTE